MKRRAQFACHWPGCPIKVEGRVWACRSHFALLPVALRARIQATYRDPRLIDYYDAALAEARVVMEQHPVRLPAV